MRCAEIGLSNDDMESMTYGMVLDIMTEKANDGEKYRELANQQDFDKF